MSRVAELGSFGKTMKRRCYGVFPEHKPSFFLSPDNYSHTKSGDGRCREHLFVAMGHHAQGRQNFSTSLLPVPLNWEAGRNLTTRPTQKGNKDGCFTPIDGVSFKTALRTA